MINMALLSKEFVMSTLTVILVIIAIVIFIYYGASFIFYLVVLLALIIGFSNTWLLSRTPTEKRAMAAELKAVNVAKSPPRKRKTARRRR